MDRQELQSRRAANQIWNGAGRYDVPPEQAAFDADGDLWLTVVTPSGGALCRARHDSWGTSVEQVVTQIDGAPLGVLSAVETGPDGKVYFAVSAEAAAKNGLESALRTELIAHTGTGCVYVYDPSARTVEQVLGGVAGAAGLALSEDGRTLYVSDLGNRCIWSVDADARELTAGQSARFSVRIRYRQPLQGARLFVRDEGAYLVFDRPQRGITPGQFAAWYDGDQLVGSGVIEG